jgi:voltage-gated potassium channel
MTLKRMVEGTDTRAGRAFDLVIEFLIVVSLVSFAVETLPDLSQEVRDVLGILEVIIVAIFTIEYILRLVVADRPLRFVFSLYGLVDLAAILPFYIASGIDLRSIRVLRLLRLFRILKLARYSKAIRRFQRAFLLVKEELILFFAATTAVLYMSSVGIYYFERNAQPETFASVFHALWWAVVTLTTVGYGDVYPVTVGGKILTGVVLMLGLAIVAAPAGLIASALSEARRLDESVPAEADETPEK